MSFIKPPTSSLASSGLVEAQAPLGAAGNVSIVTGAEGRVGGSNASTGEVQEVSFFGDGPLLVNISGLDGTGRLFFKQIPGLAEHYRVATFRLRDHGRFTYSDLVQDVASIIEGAGEERAIIVGESFGGTIALSFALAHPEMVDRLVIVNSFSRYRHRARLKLLSALVSILPRQLTWPLRFSASSLGLKLDVVKKEDRERFFEAIQTVNLDAYIRRLELIAQVDLDNRLSEIKAPTLFVAAERDIVVPSLKEARFMASRVSRSTVSVIRGAGHACMLGSKVSLASILADWTKEQVQRFGAPAAAR